MTWSPGYTVPYPSLPNDEAPPLDPSSTLSDLEARLAAIEILGDLATDSETAAAVAAAVASLASDAELAAAISNLASDAELAAAVLNLAVLVQTWDNDTTYQFQAVNSTTGTWQAVDASRLLPVTFTAPANGKVSVTYQAQGASGASNPATILQWGVHDGTGIVSGSVVTGCTNGTAAGTQQHALTAFITGLTAGQSYTWTWYHRRSQGTGACSTQWGGRDLATAVGAAGLVVRPFF